MTEQRTLHYAQADETQNYHGQTAALCGNTVPTDDVWDLGRLFDSIDRPVCESCSTELLAKHGVTNRSERSDPP